MKKLILVMVIIMVTLLLTSCNEIKKLIDDFTRDVQPPSMDRILRETGQFLQNDVIPRVEDELRKIVNEHISDEYQYLILIMRTLGTSIESDKALLFSRQGGRLPEGHIVRINGETQTIRNETIQGVLFTYVNHPFAESTEYTFEIIANGVTSTVNLRTLDNLSVRVFPEVLPLTAPFRLEWDIANDPKLQLVTTASLNLSGGFEGSLNSVRVPIGTKHRILPAGFGSGYALIRVDAATHEMNDGILAVSFADSWRVVNLPIPSGYDFMFVISENLDIPQLSASHKILVAPRPGSGLSGSNVSLRIGESFETLSPVTLKTVLGVPYFDYSFEKGRQYWLEATAQGRTGRVLLTIPQNLSVTNWPSNFSWLTPTTINWNNAGARYQAFSMVGFDSGNRVIGIFEGFGPNTTSYTIAASRNEVWACNIRVDAMNFVDRNGFVFVSTSTSWRFYQNIFTLW